MNRGEAMDLARKGRRPDMEQNKTAGIDIRIKAAAMAGAMSLEVNTTELRDVEAEAVRQDLLRRGFNVDLLADGSWEVRW